MKSPLRLLIIVFVLGCLLLSPLFFIALSDYEQYEQLAENSSLSETLSKTPVQFHGGQKRLGIRKEMWLVKNGERHCMILESPSSQIRIVNLPGQKTLAEQLFDIRCIYQETLSADNPHALPFQQLCLIEGKQATLSSDHSLAGTDVSLSRYKLEGNEIPDSLDHASPFMNGKALALQLKFGGKEIEVHTTGLKASLNQQDNP